jgi:hypothetical protein
MAADYVGKEASGKGDFVMEADIRQQGKESLLCSALPPGFPAVRHLAEGLPAVRPPCRLCTGTQSRADALKP